jgi:hypothetical protein
VERKKAAGPAPLSVTANTDEREVVTMIKGRTWVRVAVAVVAAGAVAGGAYAFTAANTVPSGTAGAGSGTISGYTISNIHYTLDTTTPVDIDSVGFNVSPVIPSSSSGKVVVQAVLTSGGPNTYACTTNLTGDTVTCTTTSPQLTADKLSSLSVVAAQ